MMYKMKIMYNVNQPFFSESQLNSASYKKKQIISE